ncbi:unnamed protein product [Rangifer tarandus platyrhynchus]|uniref:Uncharacterized protein n=2 Tax=Rangifer tarandus platyrhynchus TaxID=3082113 RepID=A0ACB0DVQ8_RANTA|nr:unnamed protein product [Rangifer tarandus platyrhynchus]CAI9692246.1 unnamed protein product [Rangifer tarandus platyrhynchus]
MLRERGRREGSGSSPSPGAGRARQLGPSKPLSPTAQLLEQRLKCPSAGLGTRLRENPDPPILPKGPTSPLQRR